MAKGTTIKDLEALYSALEERVSALEYEPVTPQDTVPESTTDDPLIPKDYRDAVRSILNQKFTPKIEYSDSAPTFQFSVLVPREYSNASGAHWAMYKEDKRVRVINNSAGPQGVKEWLEMVYNNLDAEVRARIVAERV